MIEKILEKLETEMNEVVSYDEDDYYLGKYSAYGTSIRIVQEVAKEYGNGWIPCSERLPEYCGYPVLLTVENAFGQRDVCKAFTNYMEEGKLLFYTNEKEFCSELTSSKLSDAWKPIAWMELPQGYQKGE